MTETYDDLLPVSVHRQQNGHLVLLDRHHDLLATFAQVVELADCQRLVDLVNR